MVTKIRWQDHLNRAGLYIYLLLEFQSHVDSYMAVRIMAYVALLYQGLIRSGQLTPSSTLPPVVPVVLYNGRGRWTASQNIETLVEPMPGGLELYRPRLSYLLIDEERYPEVHERRCAMALRRCSVWRIVAPPQTCNAW